MSDFARRAYLYVVLSSSGRDLPIPGDAFDVLAALASVDSVYLLPSPALGVRIIVAAMVGSTMTSQWQTAYLPSRRLPRLRLNRLHPMGTSKDGRHGHQKRACLFIWRRVAKRVASVCR